MTTTSSASLDRPAACATSLKAVAGQRVHCISNTVAQPLTANLLLAAGVASSQTLSALEIGDFLAQADALLVNLGALDRQRRQAIPKALVAVARRDLPWVLDPVMVDISPHRRNYAEALFQNRPTVIRGNAAEIAALAGATSEEATSEEAAAELARKTGAVVARTSEQDFITDGQRQVILANGHPLLSRITALGCAGSALIAAFLTVESDPLEATVQALLALEVAGELAAEDSVGPGSLYIRLLDSLYGLTETQLSTRARIN